jgi:hypothetical protein
MPVAAFDTHKYAKQLQRAGVPEEQVEAQVAALSEAMQTGLQELVTKQDLAEVKQDLAAVKPELKQDIAAVKQELTAVKQELKQDIAAVRQDMAAMKQELKGEAALIREEFKGQMLLVKWMLGVSITASVTVMALLVRLIVIRPI